MADDKKVAVTVRVRKGVEQRSRCGHSFSKEPKTVSVTAEELEAIKADPRLNIVADPKPKQKEAEAPSASAESKPKADPKPKQKK